MRPGFLISGILALVCIPIAIYLYVRKLKKDKEKTNGKNLEIENKTFLHQISHFWSHTVYLFMIFTLLVAALVLIPIGIN